MSLSPPALAHLLLSVSLLLVAAHAVGYLFRQARQPQVIGEILGGLLLGPTVLGALWPAGHDALWVDQAATETVLAALYQVGLLLLMFCSGLEMRTRFEAGERRTAAALTVSGITLPFLLAFGFVRLVGTEDHIGPAGSGAALALVVAIAVAVTSIPVIARILGDLGILDTPFGRIVLTAAVVEDTLLYVMLALALSLVGTSAGEGFGLPALLGLEGETAWSSAYHIGATVGFFAVALLLGPRAFERARRRRIVQENNPVAMLLLLLSALSLAALALGIAPFLGAFVAGLAANRAGEDESGARETIQRFSFALPIPIYFAVVGLRLDLAESFDPIFFAGLLGFACAVKLASTYAGGRFAGESPAGALNLAVAMNARGGPGIVLASVALDAGIINESLYSSLVMLAIVTSLAAGSWLGLVVRRGWPLR